MERRKVMIMVLVAVLATALLAVPVWRNSAEKPPESPAGTHLPRPQPDPTPAEEPEAGEDGGVPEGSTAVCNDTGFRITSVEFAYPFGPVSLEKPRYRIVYLGPEMSSEGQILVRFSSPPVADQSYSRLRLFQNGHVLSAYPRGATDPVYGGPAGVQYWFDTDGLHMEGVPAGALLVLIIPGETRDVQGETLGEEEWIWFSSWNYNPFDFLNVSSGFANLPKFKGDGRRVGVVMSPGGAALRASPSPDSGVVAELPQATNLLLEGDGAGGWLQATVFRVLGDEWARTSASTLDELLESPLVEPLKGFITAEEVGELPEPLNEGTVLAVIRSSSYHPEGELLPATAALLPSGGAWGYLLMTDNLEAALRGNEAKAVPFSFPAAEGWCYGGPAHVRGRLVGSLSPERHLPEVIWTAEEVAEYWRQWNRYKSVLGQWIDSFRFPETLAALGKDLVRGFHRALAANEAWMEWGISFGAAMRREEAGIPAGVLDPHRYVDLVVEKLGLSSEEEALLRDHLKGVDALADPKGAEEAYQAMTYVLANVIIRRPWLPLYNDEVEILLQGGHRPR
ncbi:MAG TPA: hypothetical protein GX510_05425 [Firmicutes bacterium]|nr:hypothetical protein [Candidatus Fermentithermobacillaceae bacterium]